jgi:selenium metabolism protein YedF
MKIIDCRNLACPAPVITVKKALEEAGGEPVQALVDSGAPRGNVTRFAVSRGYCVDEAVVEGGFALSITAGGKNVSVEAAGGPTCSRSVILIGSDRLGDGPEELGRLLMKNFIITLLDLDVDPERMLFVNTGIFLTTEGAEVLEALEKLGNRGVEILSCGVCLDFFQRKEKLRAGSVTTMFTIAESLLNAGSVIRL